MNTIRWASVLIIGIAAGYGLAEWRYPDSGSNAPLQAPPPRAAASAGARRGELPKRIDLRRPVVRVELYNTGGRLIENTTGLVVGPQRLLLLAASAMLHARSGALIEADGSRYPLNQVVGADLGNGLAVLATALSSGPAFPPPSDSGALYLGRELIAVTPDKRVRGWVDSPPLQRDDGMTYYNIRTRGPLGVNAQNAALVDPQSGRLIGLTVAVGRQPTLHEAVDAEVIADLLNTLTSRTPRTVAAFAHYYARQTARGRLDHLESLARAGRWDALIETGQTMLGAGGGDDERVRALLEKAFQAAVTEALNQGRMSQAVTLLDQATQLLGDSASRLRLRAAVAQSRGDVERARHLLHAAMKRDPALAESIYPQIRKLIRAAVINNDSLTTEQKIRLLQSELNDSPNDPVYHRLLGQLYYRHGDYKRAVDQLTRAVALDADLETPLDPMIDSARERLAIPGVTDVPLYGTDHNFLVDVQVNGDSEPLHFMLDTGSSYTAISATTARRLGISVPSRGPMTPLQTANGIIEAPIITLQSLAVNGAVVNHIDVTVVRSLGQYDGLLGLSFLKHFNFDVNQSAQTLTLRRR